MRSALGAKHRASQKPGVRRWQSCGATQLQMFTCRVSQQHIGTVDAPVASNESENARGSIDGSDSLTLDNVRSSLIRQEDTIIFSLIERAQFAHNLPVYTAGAIPVPAYSEDGRCYTLLEYLLRDTEACHGRIRRYTSPDEHPFYPESLPAMVLPPMAYRAVLAPDARAININDQIMDLYLSKILPAICQAGDDSNYGSSAMYDVLCLQALSKRIHYGKFVAEAKFTANPDEYSSLIRAQDAAGLMELLTFPSQEARVVERVRGKAATFGQDVDIDGRATNANYKVAPGVVADLYRDWVMPLTKAVQVQYLLRRLD